MARDQERFLRALWAMEDELVHAGLPPMPAWWRERLTEFYRTGKQRLIVRKGRRVYASTCVAPRLGVAEALFGEHEHVPGTPPLEYAYLSVKKAEAVERIAGIAAILNILGVPFHGSTERLVLDDAPAAFNVRTASFRTAVGSTIAYAWLDEVARWNDNELGANPAEMIVSSLAPALATLPDSKMFLNSTPLSVNDYHARQFELGETPLQCIIFGATWEINPTLTEEATRLLEPDETAWLREYAGVPTDTLKENWFGPATDRALWSGPMPEWEPGVRTIFCIDPAFDGKGSPDRFGWAAIRTTREERVLPRSGMDVLLNVPQVVEVEPRRTFVVASGSWRPEGEPSESAKKVRELCEVYAPDKTQDGLITVYSDQYEGNSFAEIARQYGLNVVVVPWTGGGGETSQIARFRSVKNAMLQDAFKFSASNAELGRQFRNVLGVLPKSGHERVQLPRDKTGHLDELAAVVLGGSIALEAAPSVPDRAKPPTEHDAMRQQAIREAKARQRQAGVSQLRRRLGMPH